MSSLLGRVFTDRYAGDGCSGVSLAVAGNTEVVGANEDDDQRSNSGSAYVFVKPAGGWTHPLTQSAELLASDGAASDFFGHSVAMAGDMIAVGAYGDDSFHTKASGDTTRDGKPLTVCQFVLTGPCSDPASFTVNGHSYDEVIFVSLKPTK